MPRPGKVRFEFEVPVGSERLVRTLRVGSTTAPHWLVLNDPEWLVPGRYRAELFERTRIDGQLVERACGPTAEFEVHADDDLRIPLR